MAERISRDNPEQVERIADTIANEYMIEICVNGQVEKVMTCSNCQLEELAVGYLFTEGYAANPSDILAVKLSEDRRRVDITAQNMDVFEKKPMPEKPCDSIQVKPEVLMELSERLLSENPWFDATGALHSAALSEGGSGFAHFSVDLKRHNAVDKAVGEAVLQKTDLSKCILFTTGRIPSDMIWKAIRSGIPAVVSRGAVTMQSIELARRYGILLCGFSRGKRINIYTENR